MTYHNSIINTDLFKYIFFFLDDVTTTVESPPKKSSSIEQLVDKYYSQNPWYDLTNSLDELVRLTGWDETSLRVIIFNFL